MSHAPGIAAFTNAASPEQRASFFGATDQLKAAVAAAAVIWNIDEPS